MDDLPVLHESIKNNLGATKSEVGAEIKNIKNHIRLYQLLVNRENGVIHKYL